MLLFQADGDLTLGLIQITMCIICMYNNMTVKARRKEKKRGEKRNRSGMSYLTAHLLHHYSRPKEGDEISQPPSKGK